MTTTELRDSDLARTVLTQGLWLQRLSPVVADTTGPVLFCALSLSAEDEAIPPTGFIADVIRLIDGPATAQPGETLGSSGLAPQIARAYEDYVLGKLYADVSFERASAAVARYDEADRIRATAWLIARLCEQVQSGGVVISPAVIRSLHALPPEELLENGTESLQTEGVLPLLSESYEQLIAGFRMAGEVLAAEDVFELERGTALVEFGQRLALRQTLRAAAEFESSLPRQPPRPTTRQRNVPTQIPEEDTYPVGGFTSISTRGSIESLLHSQLAYMEKDESRRPDLFEIRFLRSELLYYSRDDNDFLRQRRTIQLVLDPSLKECRIKDPDQPYQRLILILAILVTLIRNLTEWLSDDALLFEILFVTAAGQQELADEQHLLELVFEEQIQDGTVVVDAVSGSGIPERAEQHARTSMTHSLLFSTSVDSLEFDQAMPLRISVACPKPELQMPDDSSFMSCESFDDLLNQLVSELI